MDSASAAGKENKSVVSNNQLRYLFQNVTFFCFGGTLIQADIKHASDIYDKVSFVEGRTASPSTKRHDQEVKLKFLKTGKFIHLQTVPEL